MTNNLQPGKNVYSFFFLAYHCFNLYKYLTAPLGSVHSADPGGMCQQGFRLHFQPAFGQA